MRIIISGGGDIGRLTAESLVNAGHEVVIIERQRDVCERLAEELDVLVICGDATRPDVLEKAGIEKADLIIALSGDDKMNLLTALVAREEYDIKRVIVKLDDPAFNMVCQRLGVEEIVNPKIATAKHISDMARRPHALEVSTLVGGSIRVFTTIIHKPEHKGKRIDALGLPENSIAVVVQRGEEFFIPTSGFRVMDGDHLTILCEEKELDVLTDTFE